MTANFSTTELRRIGGTDGVIIIVNVGTPGHVDHSVVTELQKLESEIRIYKARQRDVVRNVIINAIELHAIGSFPFLEEAPVRTVKGKLAKGGNKRKRNPNRWR